MNEENLRLTLVKGQRLLVIIVKFVISMKLQKFGKLAPNRQVWRRS